MFCKYLWNNLTNQSINQRQGNLISQTQRHFDVHLQGKHQLFLKTEIKNLKAEPNESAIQTTNYHYPGIIHCVQDPLMSAEYSIW